MALQNTAALLIFTGITFCAASVSSKTVYTVGDSDGWHLNVDYDRWTADKHFFVGDILIFNYDQDYHNVLLVKNQNFLSCDGSSPNSSYASGHDSITLTSEGDFFFICGFPGHCEAGQKLFIQVEDAETVLPNSEPYPDEW
ncbi:hypothetical protein JCGZ_19602 [Jatropha curcas]|uniref:Phytocyanin domain-containing protein n=1 Tax=Jatropha curcas TaxID=180498 RepID=A0A067JUL9_JATCU|nr:mavicyanin [Jatropha curcas]KDP27597.1 hypothetical protein JCGZ_19602 [Jatropha curcas]